MNLIGIFIFTIAAADNFIFDKENGILFEREEDIYVFDASAQRTVAIPPVQNVIQWGLWR
jgi:hypothetical protein